MLSSSVSGLGSVIGLFDGCLPGAGGMERDSVFGCFENLEALIGVLVICLPAGEAGILNLNFKGPFWLISKGIRFSLPHHHHPLGNPTTRR